MDKILRRTFFLISFRSSHIFFIIFLRSSRAFLKKHEIFSEAVTHTKKCSKAAAQFFVVAAQNINKLREDFHNLSMAMNKDLRWMVKKRCSGI